MGKWNLNLHQFGHQQVCILLMNPDLYQHAKLMFWIQVFFFFTLTRDLNRYDKNSLRNTYLELGLHAAGEFAS